MTGNTILKHCEERTIHEDKILGYFGDRVVYRNSHAIIDKPLVVLLFTNRCGSNLFSDYITSLRLVGDMAESLNFEEVIRRSEKFSISSFPEYIERSSKVFTSQGIPYGVKASVGQLCMLSRWNITKMFSETIVFHVVRGDLLDQAISMSIAMQNKQWTSTNSSISEQIDFKFDEISSIIEQNSSLNAAGRLFVQAAGFKYELFTYEAFSNDPRTAIQRVSNALGVNNFNLSVPSPTIRKQANERNSEFRDRFLSILKQRSLVS